MQILYAHRVEERGQRPCIGFIDIELDEHVRLYGLRVVRQPDGRHVTYAPQCGQRRSATFSREFAEELTAAAVAALGDAQ